MFPLASVSARTVDRSPGGINDIPCLCTVDCLCYPVSECVINVIVSVPSLDHLGQHILKIPGVGCGASSGLSGQVPIVVITEACGSGSQHSIVVVVSITRIRGSRY